MTLPSFKPSTKKSESSKMSRGPETSFPAGEAIPFEIRESNHVPTPPLQARSANEYIQTQYSPRPRSSWYSQPGLSGSSTQVHSHTHDYRGHGHGHGRPPSSPPPVPRLTSSALRSLEARFAVPTSRPSEAESHQYYGSSNPWHHQFNDNTNDEDEHSPTSPSSQSRPGAPVRRVSVDAFLSASKHTPVSEYLRDRTWIPESPAMPGYPPVNEDRLSRRQSLRQSVSSLVDRTVRKGSTSSSGESDRGYGHSHARLVSNAENRKSILTARPERRRSSVPTLPHLPEDQYQEVDMGSLRAEDGRPAGPRPQTGRTVQMRNAGFVGRQSTSGSNIGVPYKNTRMGPTPIPVSTIWSVEGHRNHVSSQKARPQVITHQQMMTPPATTVSRTPSSAAQSSWYHSRSNPLARMYARPPGHAQILRTRTRDAFGCSEQGSFLFIGTLRGPTPAGLRTLHATMDKAIAKHGEVEGALKGCKEIRKFLKHENRGVIEWTIAYVRGRWGVDV